MRIPSKHTTAFLVVGIAILTMVALIAMGWVHYIDNKLKQGSKQQVITFTEQAAGNVAEHIYIIQDVIDSFGIQSVDPKEVQVEIASIQECFEFSDIAFVDMSGEGVHGDGRSFTVSDLIQEETALSRGEGSFSQTYVSAEGSHVFLVQQPIEVNGEQMGALYVEVPLSIFDLPESLDMFDGSGYFILIKGETGEILTHSAGETLPPLTQESWLYDFLGSAAEQGTGQARGISTQSMRFPANELDIDLLRQSASNKTTGLSVGVLDGVESYVCIAPVGQGSWCVCTIIPVENVRPEEASVTTAFQVVFFISATCIVLALCIGLSYYRKRMQEKDVQAKTQLYSALSNSLDLLICLYSPSDGDTTSIAMNPDDALSSALQSVLADDNSPNRKKLSSECLEVVDRVRSGKNCELEQGEESFLSTKTGDSIWLAYSVRPLMYEGKQQVLIVVRDVTEEKRVNLSMRDAMIDAEAANRAKSEFLSRMSHEIRSPLNAIIGMLSIAGKNLSDPVKQKRSLDKMSLASEHLLSLINDVLDLSKIESGKMVLACEVFCLEDIIDHLNEVIQTQCVIKKQTFVISVSGNTQEMLESDPVRMRQLLVNLLVNAIKYTPEYGQVKLDVSIEPSSLTSYRSVTFVVSDNGIGMEKDFCERMFEPFAMEGRSNQSGTGLGMSIVKTIVSLMNGTIYVESQVGKGTRITVSMDIKVANEDYMGKSKSMVASEAVAKNQTRTRRTLKRSSTDTAQSDDVLEKSGSPSQNTRPLEGVRILLAEDQEINVEVACELIGYEGAQLVWAKDGQEACRMFEESKPGTYDAVLMDVQMPVMDGYQATRYIRSLNRPDGAQIPIIAMSANAFANDVRASLDAGMNAHMSKPIDVQKVVATLLAELKRAQEQE